MSDGKNAATGGWVLFVDALDEARASGSTGTKRRTGRPKRHLTDVETRMLKQAEQIRRRLDRQLATKGADWVPDAGFIEAHRAATHTITQVARSLRLSKQAERESMGRMSEAELDAAFLVELRRVAPRLVEDEWRALLTSGMGEDIAEAALSVWRDRRAAADVARTATRFRTGEAPEEP